MSYSKSGYRGLIFILRQEVEALIKDNSVTASHKLRLVILYALRYQKTQASSVASLINLALENGVQREDARVSRCPVVEVYLLFLTYYL